MKTVTKWLLGAFVASLGALQALSATQRVMAPCVWIGSTTGTANDGTYLSPADVFLTDGQRQVFTAYPPNGYQVTWWAWGPKYLPNVGILDANNKPLTNLVSNVTTYEWTSKPSDGARTIGVRFDYFPYTVELYKNDGKGSDHVTMGPYYYPDQFKLVANSFVRPGYVYTGWHNPVTQTDLTDQASVSGAILGVTHDPVMRLYANWNPIRYEVAFDGNGATGGSMAKQSFTYDVGQALSANAYVRQYGVTFDAGGGSVTPASATATATFDGWALSASGNKRFDNGASVQNLTNEANATVTLYAKWTLGKVTLPTPTKENCVFNGWYDAAEGGNLIGAAGSEYAPSSGQTIYAQWTQKYAARFRYRNADGMWTYSEWQYMEPGVFAKAPADEVVNRVTGYRFVGWDPVSLQVLQPNQTFEAQYKANVYYINLKANDGSDRTRLRECTYDQTYTLDDTFDRPGYTLAEWNTETGGGGAAFALGAQVKNLLSEDTASTNLYAQWTANAYGLTFDANGGTGTMEPMSLRYDEEATLPKNVFVNNGRPFLGWRFDGKTYADEAVVSNLTTVAGTNLVFKAIWKDLYWISYLPNGGTGEMPAQAVDVGETVSLTANAFTYLGCSFAGWATNATSAVKYADGAAVKDLAEAGETNALYAVWSTNSYSVAFVRNGGEGAMTNVTYRCHEPASLPSNEFVRVSSAGSWTFKGWAFDPAAAEPAFADGQEVTNLTYVADAEVTLYALWREPNPSEPAPLAIAVDCPNLTFEKNDQSKWGIVSNSVESLPGSGGIGPGTNQYARTSPPSVGATSQSQLNVCLPQGRGMLRFAFRTSIDTTPFRPSSFSVSHGVSLGSPIEITKVSESVSWRLETYQKTEEEPEYVSWTLQKNMGNDSDWADVDAITWIPDDVHTVAITFRLNDGTPAPADIWANYTVTSGLAIAQWPADPVGADFSGWFTAAKGGAPVTATDLAPASDTVLFAHWGTSFPVPTEADRVEASGVSTVDGRFALEFTADENFAYNLLATDSLAPTNWYKLYGPTNGTGVIRLTPAMDVPQRFFKIETIQRTE